EVEARPLRLGCEEWRECAIRAGSRRSAVREGQLIVGDTDFGRTPRRKLVTDLDGGDRWPEIRRNEIVSLFRFRRILEHVGRVPAVVSLDDPHPQPKVLLSVHGGLCCLTGEPEGDDAGPR